MENTILSGHHRRFIIGRNIDFWMIGGGSILFFLLAHFFEHFRFIPQFNTQLNNIDATASFLALLVNNPHFVISYKLAYANGIQAVKRNLIQLFIVPLVLLVGFTVSFFFFKEVGTEFLKWSVLTMYFTVIWHYSKQSYGCTVVYAHFDDYHLSKVEKGLLRYQLLSVGWASYTYSNSQGTWHNYFGLSYNNFNLGLTPYYLSLGLWTLLTLSVLGIFLKKYKECGQLPSLNMLAPLLALNFWWHPWIRHEKFYNVLAAFFHCLQYLTFVYRIETAALEEKFGRSPHTSKKEGSSFELEIPQWKSFSYLLTLIGINWLYFDFIPYRLDAITGSNWKMEVQFFAITALLFINIHHYFLDNAIWKFKTPMMKKYLL